MHKESFAILFIELLLVTIVVQAQAYSDPIAPTREYHFKIKRNAYINIYNVINSYYNMNNGYYIEIKNNTSLKICVTHKDGIVYMNVSIIYNNIKWYNTLQIVKDDSNNFIVNQGKNIAKIKPNTYIS